jgi:hypothetical protein
LSVEGRQVGADVLLKLVSEGLKLGAGAVRYWLGNLSSFTVRLGNCSTEVMGCFFCVAAEPDAGC